MTILRVTSDALAAMKAKALIPTGVDKMARPRMHQRVPSPINRSRDGGQYAVATPMGGGWVLGTVWSKSTLDSREVVA